MKEEDVSAREDEAAVIQSIFPDLFFQESPSRIILTFDDDIRLTIDLPDDYPSNSPPIFELSGPSLRPDDRTFLTNELNEEYINNMGNPILFAWISTLQEFIQAKKHEEADALCETVESKIVIPVEETFEIKHGEVFSDRKSHFQAHLCEVISKEEVGLVMKQLLQNNKIARATHNIYAYRIRQEKDGKTFIVHDCEDDGEDGASSKMLEILDKMKAENVIVVVTRWYGGIHLGPDRFRIINNLTREIAQQYGYGKN